MAGPEPWQIVPTSSPPSAGEIQVPIRLDVSETLVWAGRPSRASYARPSLFVILLGLVVTGLAVGWIVLTYLGLGSLMEHVRGLAILFSFLPCCGVPFLLIGLWILFSPVRQWRAGRRTCYLLTTKRVILCEPGWGQSVAVSSYSPPALGQMKCVEWPNGTGDLVFEEHPGIETTINGQRTVHPVRRGFLGIEHVRSVEQLVRRTLRL